MDDRHDGHQDEDPTRVSPVAGSGSVSGTPSASVPAGGAEPPIEDIDVPHRPDATAAAHPVEAAAAARAATEAARAAVPSTGTTAPDAPAATSSGATAPDAPAEAGPTMRERTAEGARFAADRASSAASATVQALRDTDVREIANQTTSLVENTRPFFLTAFAIAFAFLAAVENHAAIGVVLATGAVLCVLGAAYSREIDLLLTGRATARRRRG